MPKKTLTSEQILKILNSKKLYSDHFPPLVQSIKFSKKDIKKMEEEMESLSSYSDSEPEDPSKIPPLIISTNSSSLPLNSDNPPQQMEIASPVVRPRILAPSSSAYPPNTPQIPLPKLPIPINQPLPKMPPQVPSIRHRIQNVAPPPSHPILPHSSEKKVTSGINISSTNSNPNYSKKVLVPPPPQQFVPPPPSNPTYLLPPPPLPPQISANPLPVPHNVPSIKKPPIQQRVQQIPPIQQRIRHLPPLEFSTQNRVNFVKPLPLLSLYCPPPPQMPSTSNASSSESFVAPGLSHHAKEEGGSGNFFFKR